LPAPEAALVAKQIEKNGIRLLFNRQIQEMRGDASGKVSKLITTKGESIDCQFVGIATGVKPNITLTKGTKIQADKGILVNEYLETSCEDVYAIGDCVQFTTEIEGRKKIEQVWYTGRMHGETLALSLSGKRTAYRPGPWFNSAKFFDLEYQTYGLVSGKLNDDEKYFYWQHPKKDIGFGVVFHGHTKMLKGVNSYGMRLRHECFDRWLKEKCTADNMLSMLDQALFDPEFSKNNVEQIITAYNSETGSSVKRKKSLFPFFTH
jgi:NADPH-dependent 2,4-dienoyl-CoA reductase/sulfur reductase-like enzyme